MKIKKGKRNISDSKNINVKLLKKKDEYLKMNLNFPNNNRYNNLQSSRNIVKPKIGNYYSKSKANVRKL